MKIVYILSSPHGGSTLLSHLLGTHQAIANLGEVTFLPKLLALGEACSCSEPVVNCEAWKKVFSQLHSQTGVDLGATPYGLPLGDAIKQKQGSGLVDREQQTRSKEVIAKIRGAYDTAALLGAPQRGLLKLITLPSIRESLDNTFSFYEAVSAAWNTDVLVDASKTLKKGPRLYLERPDDVRIIHMVRDGRGVVASRAKYMPVANAAERWHHYHRLSNWLLERWVNPAHRRLLRYEDLATDPANQMRSLLEWLELDYHGNAALESPARSHAAGGNPARFSMSDGVRGVDERWRESLTEADLRSFEKIAGRTNLQFGYV